ncbi:hypothetical protein XELAEV_18019413mg [Xenopus laevis]|uniref:Olfactory receptor n=1 Tax=Xenopus laevis TaxID=8355 RepID=A0A974HUT1_XENLA|nr:hypothetical protein XELAEV_18019413mg [Xenopus laevis]
MCSLVNGSLNDRNQTEITHFILVGIGGPQSLKVPFCFIFLMLYFMTMSVNLLIIGLFLQGRLLNSPMYFFLSHLSLCDIMLSTSVVPNLLSTLLTEGEAMMFSGCITQFLATGATTAAECYLLTAMSYDRYLAICNPLRYISIMNNRLCAQLVMLSWLLSLLYCIIDITEIYDLDFCGCNVLDYIYCDIEPLLELSCKNTSNLQNTTMIISVPAALFPFLFILSTYIKISITIFRISSSTGKQKAFSTCSSHLTVACTYFGILIAKYTVPSNSQSLNVNKAISLLYTAVTPVLNPMIYSFRNKEIRSAVTKWISIRTGMFMRRRILTNA